MPHTSLGVLTTAQEKDILVPARSFSSSYHLLLRAFPHALHD
jgi:hypothetical protein